MSAHTPGPWTLREPVKATGDERMDWGITAQIDGETSLIAECFWRVGVQRYAACDANARLIAAAPRMLETLKVLEARIRHAKQAGSACVHIDCEGLLSQWTRAILRDVEGSDGK